MLVKTRRPQVCYGLDHPLKELSNNRRGHVAHDHTASFNKRIGYSAHGLFSCLQIRLVVVFYTHYFFSYWNFLPDCVFNKPPGLQYVVLGWPYTNASVAVLHSESVR